MAGPLPSGHGARTGWASWSKGCQTGCVEGLLGGPLERVNAVGLGLTGWIATRPRWLSEKNGKKSCDTDQLNGKSMNKILHILGDGVLIRALPVEKLFDAYSPDPSLAS